jgi:hypothetical protein
MSSLVLIGPQVVVVVFVPSTSWFFSSSRGLQFGFPEMRRGGRGIRFRRRPRKKLGKRWEVGKGRMRFKESGSFHRVMPEVGRGEVSGESGTIEEMRGGLVREIAVRTGWRRTSAESVLVGVEFRTETRTELRESGAVWAGKHRF